MKGSGLALKTLQWFVRGVEFLCAALILAIFSYFLATLHNHDLPIANWIRAVEGISGAAVVYTALALLLLCCLAGRTITSFLAIALDIAFCGAFIYIAVANKGGAGSCSGDVDTPFGFGNANTDKVSDGQPGFTALPSLRTACKLETACFAVAIVGVFFFLLSALLEVALARHHQKEKRFGPSPANNYTSGSAKKGGFGRFFSRRKRGTGYSENPNALPQHAHPADVRDSYATEQTRVGTAAAEPVHKHNKHGEAGFAGEQNAYGNPTHPAQSPYTSTGLHQNGVTTNATHGVPVGTAHTHYPAGNNTYEDGVYDNTRR